MKKRVVVTGLGIVAPNGIGGESYEQALREGRSGIRYVPEMAERGFACQVAGIPPDFASILERYFPNHELLSVNDNVGYAAVAALEAWRDAGFRVPAFDEDCVDWDTGAIIGSGIGGIETISRIVVPMVNEGKVRRLGSRIVEQVMASGASAMVAGLLALGNQVTANSSACSTGNEAIIESMMRIRAGLAKRMLAGGTEGASIYIWAGFDAMRVICRKFNDEPEKASRPMSASAAGFVPGAGAGILLLEELDSALARGAKIYAEVLGGSVNCGGHRMGGSMTAPNPEGVIRCIRRAIDDAGVRPGEVDAINGHLTATFADPLEVKNWAEALGRGPENFPYIQSTKSLVGHGLGAAGGLECVAVALQLYKGFIHPSVNAEDVHPEISEYADAIPKTCIENSSVRIFAKAGFGFGDVNSCIIFKKWEGE
ncbi:MAG TPA: beta-ketoacyl-[acyl-carrier-protein] synthase family protein [Syntrophales bacterium]|nr:beta-ketoacyl-[acyl-carrier-protein] synthase family protein [Syntrophales bacterium]HOL58444.1 beta-ketoacyl-[acyl-carrier-protein] synthase family protein [Syntrophales bacterium]HPO34613.1 beta-ketoacyl-[acyl-carrier-protein] synthase family protein [Syntrophales bacterium]